MPNPFTWIFSQARGFYQRLSGDRVEQTVRNVETLIDRYINLSASRYAQELLGLLKSGMGRQEWELAFRQRLKTMYIASYMAGKGGTSAMTQADWGRIGAMLVEQYKHLGHFADQLWAGELNVGPVSLRERQLVARIAMYFKSAREAYNRALAAGHQMPTLPQYPGDGKTICRCITTPDSKVLTAIGWLPMKDVRPGMLVLTHAGNWKPVTRVIVKPSQPYHRQAWLRAPGGAWVGCTDTQKWYTNDGWHDATDIDSLGLMVYTLSEDIQRRIYHEAVLPNVREVARTKPQERSVYGVPEVLPLWQPEGPQGSRVQVLCGQGVSYEAMGQRGRARQEAGRDSQRRGNSSVSVRGHSRGEHLADQAGWTAVHPLLGHTGTQAVRLPLPMVLDNGTWADTQGVLGTPQRREQDQRFAGQSGANGVAFSCAPAWGHGAYGGASQESQGLRGMRGNVLSGGQSGQAVQVLFAGMLPPGTALWDIEVADDHSFIIEGLPAHNTNCQCHLEIDETDEEWQVTWVLGAAEHCPDCVRLASNWTPLKVSKTPKPKPLVDLIFGAPNAV